MKSYCKKVLRLVEDNSFVIEEAEDKTLSLIVGRTGAGKGGVTNAALGNALGINESDQVVLANPVTGEEMSASVREEMIASGRAAEIGHGAESCSMSPKLYRHPEKGHYLLDCAGFGDTRSKAHRVAISIGMEALVKRAKKIKNIFIVVNYFEIQAGRGASFKDLVSLMASIFKNIESARPAIHFVFTHLDDLYYKLERRIDPNRLGNMAESLQVHEEISDLIYTKLEGLVANHMDALNRQASYWGSALSYVKDKINRGRDKHRAVVRSQVELDPFYKNSANFSNALTVLHLIQQSLSDKRAILFNAVTPAHMRYAGEKIIEVIDRSQLCDTFVPREALNFYEYDQDRVEFQDKVLAASWELSGLLEKLNVLPLDIADLNREIAHLETLVEKYETQIPEDAASDDGEKIDRIELLQTMDNELTELIAKDAEKLANETEHLTELEGELNALDSSSLETVTKKFEETRWTLLVLPYFFGYSQKTFTINEKKNPIHSYTVNTHGSGKYTEGSYEPKKGQLEVTYTSKTGVSGQCTLTVKYERRYFDTNPTKILNLRQKIKKSLERRDTLKMIQAQHCKRESALSSTIKRDVNTIGHVTDEIKEMISTYKGEIESYKTELAQCQQELENTEDEYKQQYRLMGMIKTLLLITGASKKTPFLSALAQYENQNHQTFSPNVPGNDRVATLSALSIRSDVCFSDLSNDLVDTPVRFTSCGHILDLTEFERLFEREDTHSVACPCCVNEGIDPIPVQKGDYSQYAVDYNLARQLYDPIKTRISESVVESASPEEGIRQLEHEINNKENKLFQLKASLATLRRGMEETQEHDTGSESDRGEGVFSPGNQNNFRTRGRSLSSSSGGERETHGFFRQPRRQRSDSRIERGLEASGNPVNNSINQGDARITEVPRALIEAREVAQASQGVGSSPS